MNYSKSILKRIGKYILFFLLFHVWYILFYPFTWINVIVCFFKTDDHGEGYWQNSSLNGDKFACQEFRAGLNLFFTTKWSYRFGLIKETMSSVFGKNQRTQRLTGLHTNPTPAKAVCGFLDFVDEKHCEKSINDNISWDERTDLGLVRCIANLNRKPNEAQYYLKIWTNKAGVNCALLLTEKEYQKISLRSIKNLEDWVND